MSTLTKYGGKFILAHGVSDERSFIIEWLETSTERDDALPKTKVASRKSAQKLRSYLTSDPTTKFRQPAIDLPRACGCFDPLKATTLRFHFESVTRNILWLDEADNAVADIKL